MYKFVFSVALALLATGLGSAETAAAGDLDGLYFSGNYGRARSTYDQNFVADQLTTFANATGGTLAPDSSRVFRTSSAWWADAGYWFGPNFGVDAAFLHLGQLKYSSAGSLTVPTGSNPVTYPYLLGAEVSSHGPALALVGRLPLTESLEMDARVGDYYGKTTLTTGFELNSPYSVSADSASGSSLLLGVGAGYSFGTHWSLRVEYLRIGQIGNKVVGKFDVNLPAVGFSFTL